MILTYLFCLILFPFSHIMSNEITQSFSNKGHLADWVGTACNSWSQGSELKPHTRHRDYFLKKVSQAPTFFPSCFYSCYLLMQLKMYFPLICMLKSCSSFKTCFICPFWWHCSLLHCLINWWFYPQDLYCNSFKQHLS